MEKSSNHLRNEIAHMLIDLGYQDYQRTKVVHKLAAVLQEKLGKNVSWGTLAMALSGYRSTPAYIEYLTTLKAHLEECISTGANPVTVHTKNTNNQGKHQFKQMGA